MGEWVIKVNLYLCEYIHTHTLSSVCVSFVIFLKHILTFAPKLFV